MGEVTFFMEHTEMMDQINMMGEKVFVNLTVALEALKNKDAKLTCETIKNEEAINKLHLKIEHSAINVVATKQPVASNLRTLISVFKIAKSLERIGDYAVHIAKEGKRLADTDYPGDISILETMVQMTIEMLQSTGESFRNLDSSAAREIASRDDIIDAKHKEFIADILVNITKDPGNADMYTRLVSTVNSAERIGDHITDMCESIVYMAEGRYVDLNEK